MLGDTTASTADLLCPVLGLLDLFTRCLLLLLGRTTKPDRRGQRVHAQHALDGARDRNHEIQTIFTPVSRHATQTHLEVGDKSQVQDLDHIERDTSQQRDSP